MRRLLLALLFLQVLILQVSAMEFTAPDVPSSGAEFMPKESNDFSSDLIYVIKTAINKLQPDIMSAVKTCVAIIAITILLSVSKHFSKDITKTTALVRTLSVSYLLIKPTNTLIQLGIDTVTELSDYGKLLLPVMTAALAAQGGTSTSASLYSGTIVFDTLITRAISNVLIPLLYTYIGVSIAANAINEPSLKSIKDFSKWLITWILKITLYVFTGYMSVTGVVSGTTDAAALKAAKLTISSAVPVVGNILSDASESILVSASVMKNAAGTYGLIALIAVFISPFIRIGIQYILLKVTVGVCTLFDGKESVEIISDFSSALGLLLAMTSTICLLLMISTVCFMRGVE